MTGKATNKRGSGIVWFFFLAAIADGEEWGKVRRRLIFKYLPLTPTLPVWRGEGVRHIIRHYNKNWL